MKNWILSILLIFPIFGYTQTENGRFAIGTQFYQNLNLPDNYIGFGTGVNWQLDFVKGLGLDVNYFFETNDLANTGSIKRFQRGAAVNYLLAYNRKLSPWVQIGAVFNTLTVSPVSYLFSDKSDEKIEQSYFGLTAGLGGRYNLNRRASVNIGIYIQPQNYNPNFELVSENEGMILKTDLGPEIEYETKALVYFNIGLTYQIAKLW